MSRLWVEAHNNNTGKREIIYKEINVLHAIKLSKIIITKAEIFTTISGTNMYMIDVPYVSYVSVIKRAKIGL